MALCTAKNEGSRKRTEGLHGAICNVGVDQESESFGRSVIWKCDEQKRLVRNSGVVSAGDRVTDTFRKDSYTNDLNVPADDLAVASSPAVWTHHLARARKASTGCAFREILINRRKVEGWCTRELGFGQVGHDLCFATHRYLMNWHGNEFLSNAEKSAKRKNKGRQRGVVEINQNIFDLAHGRIPLLDTGTD